MTVIWLICTEYIIPFLGMCAKRSLCGIGAPMKLIEIYLLKSINARTNIIYFFIFDQALSK